MGTHAILAFLNIQMPELLLLGLIGILLFGRRLPEIGKNLGRSIVEFKKGLNSTEQEIEQAAHEDEAPTPPARPVVTSTKRHVKQIAAPNSDEP